MLTLHPQYIKDAEGNNSLVILPAKEFDTILEELEDLEDIKLYDEAKKEDTGERILFSDYLKKQKIKECLTVPSFYLKKAQKQSDKLPDSVAEPVIKAITGLGENPRPAGYKKLRAVPPTFPRSHSC